MTDENNPTFMPKNHGICKYCGENILSHGLMVITCYSIKLRDGSDPKWHPECYNEALARALMAQKK